MRLWFVALLFLACDTTPTAGYCDQSNPCVFSGEKCNGDNCRLCQGDQCGQLVCDPIRHACVVEALDSGTKSGDGP
jgi:hypothetical protein